MNIKETTEINDKLFNYVKGLNLINPDKLTLDTLLEKDLGITGDDAIDFIEEFAQEFNVDISSFDYSKYFREEGFNVFEVFSRLLFREKNINHADVSIRKLREAVHNKKLK